MTRAALALVVVAACACGAAQAHPGIVNSDKVFLEHLSYLTVRILVICPDGAAGGSGVVLDTGIVATAHHVIDAAIGHPECMVFADGVSASLRAWNDEADVALLSTLTPPSGPLCLSQPYLGMPVIVMGFPSQRITGEAGFQVSRGHLIAENSGLYRVSASSNFGGSGGPVFDEDGCLVGLLVSLLTDMLGKPVDDHYFVTPASHLGRLYAANKELLAE